MRIKLNEDRSNAETLHITIAVCTWMAGSSTGVCECAIFFSSYYYYYYIYLFMAWANTLHSIESYKLIKKKIKYAEYGVDARSVRFRRYKTTRCALTHQLIFFFPLLVSIFVEWKGEKKLFLKFPSNGWLIWIRTFFSLPDSCSVTRSINYISRSYINGVRIEIKLHYIGEYSFFFLLYFCSFHSVVK